MDGDIATAVAELNEIAVKAIAEIRTDVQTIKDQIGAERKEREALEIKLNRGGLRQVSGDDNAALAAEHKALGAFVKSELRDAVNSPELKSMSVGSDPDGGFLVLPARGAQFITRLRDESAIRRLARVEAMSSGDAWEEVVDLEVAGASWVGEHEARTATTTPRLGMLRVPLHEQYAMPVVTQKLLDTSYIDIGAWLDGKINDAFAVADASAFVSGNGVGKPRGFLDHPTATTADTVRTFGTLQYVASGKADGFATSNPADKLRALMWSLRAPYRRDAVWLMNSNTASAIDQMKDGTGQYLWRPGQTAGAPASLLGYPVEIDENMPDVGADAYPIAFGNFRLGYLIIERAGLKMLRDPYTDKPNVNFYAYRRVGGDVANSDAIKLLKIAAS